MQILSSQSFIDRTTIVGCCEVQAQAALEALNCHVKLSSTNTEMPSQTNTARSLLLSSQCILWVVVTTFYSH